VWCRCYSWRILTICNRGKQCIAVRKPHRIECRVHGSTRQISWLVAEIVLDVPRLGLPTLVVMSIHLSCKYAKKPVAGPHALAEALDTAQRRLSELGSPSLDIVCGDINMARPPLSSFKYMALSRFGRSSGFFSRRSSAMLRAAPLPCCSALLPCCSALLLAAQCCPRCAALPRLETVEPSGVERRHFGCLREPRYLASLRLDRRVLLRRHPRIVCLTTLRAGHQLGPTA